MSVIMLMRKPDFDNYRLPSIPIRCPLHDVVEVRQRPRGRNLLISRPSRAPSSDDDTSSSEEEEDDEPATKAYRLTNHRRSRRRRTIYCQDF